MNKLKLLLLLLCLGLITASPALSAQIGGKALGDVDDVVKEATHGSLEIPKHSIMLLKAGEINDNNSYLQSNIMTLNYEGETATKTLQVLSNQGKIVDPLKGTTVTERNLYGIEHKVTRYEGGIQTVPVMNLTPVVSRRSYNGKKVVMWNTTNEDSFKAYFAALQNNSGGGTDFDNPTTLANSLSTTLIGNPYETKFTKITPSNGKYPYVSTYGSIVLNVKGYDGEVFINSYGEGEYNVQDLNATGAKAIWIKFGTISEPPDYYYTGLSSRTKMNFFSINADDSGNPAFTKLDLKLDMSFSSNAVQLVSMTAVDIDDDGYTDDFAVLVNTDIDVRLYFYKLVYDGSKFTLKRHGNNEYKLYTAPEAYRFSPSKEASSQVIAGDFDGDGKFEVAAVYKKIRREKSSDSGRDSGGRVVGDIGVHVFKWDFSRGTFESQSSSKAYGHHRIALIGFGSDLTGSTSWHHEYWSGVAGLKAAAADLNGDGKDEIVTLLIGYYRMSAWDPSWKLWCGTQSEFDMYPYLAVWSCPRGLITPQHDEDHVKGHGIDEGPLAKYGSDQSKLFGESLWWYKYYYSKYPGQSAESSSSGRTEPDVYGGYTVNYFSMAAGPFTGTVGVGKTVDDIVVAWNQGWEQDSWTNIYLFKTNVSGGSFTGFSDYKKIAELPKAVPQGVTASSTGKIWTGMLAADFAGEGVELDVPTHVKDEGDRSYIAILNAPPYHVDTVSADGNSLVTAPHNFTYSGGGDGQMRVYYDNTTADDDTKAVTFDLSNSVETILMVDSEATQKFFGPAKKGISFVSSFIFERHAWDGTTWVDAALGAITDKIDTTDKTVKETSKTVTLTDNLEAKTRDSIIFYNADRHIWRYPVLTNPVPEWLLSGSRIDSTSGDISDFKGNPYHFVTFAMYDDGTKYVRDSLTDTEYQPIHEEGNLFSYPPLLAANEGYIAGATLTTPTRWSFGASSFNSSAAFKEVAAEERQTDKKVERSAVTQIVEGVNSFFQGENAASYTPQTDNPQKFSKSYSKEEKIGFTLKGRNDLVNRGAGNELAFQAYTGKEGAMTLATAVTLAATSPQNFLWRDSLYTGKADPALLLPFKFIEQGSDFVANTDNVAAMQLRGMRYYLPELLSFTDNRLITGLDYQIHVPVYNASFKASGTFTARLSYSASNEPNAAKTALATTTISLNGWSNDRNQNKGWLVFKVPGSATQNISSGNYYLWVELDTGSAVDEVHESRMASDNRTVRDYGGNNAGYSGVVFVNMSSSSLLTKNGGGVRASFSPAGFRAAASGDVNGKTTTISTYLTMNGLHNLADLDTFLNSQEDSSVRVPVLCEITYSGEYVIPYATMTGYHVSNSSAKLAEYGYELENIPKGEKEEFAYKSFAMIPVQTSRFYLMLCADDMKHPADDGTDTVTYFEIGIPGFDVNFNWASEGAVDILLGDDSVEDVYSYLEDVAAQISADAPAVSADVVTVAESRDFTLSKPSAVYWRIKEVKMLGASGTDYVLETKLSRTHSVDLSAMDTSFDENADMASVQSMFTPEVEPDNEVVLTVSSVPYATKKGVYEIYVQTSTGKVSTGDADDENSAVQTWTDEEPLVFEVAGGGQSTTPDGGTVPVTGTVGSSGGGCDSGLSVAGLMIGLSLLVIRRKR